QPPCKGHRPPHDLPGCMLGRVPSDPLSADLFGSTEGGKRPADPDGEPRPLAAIVRVEELPQHRRPAVRTGRLRTAGIKERRGRGAVRETSSKAEGRQPLSGSLSPNEATLRCPSF